MGERNWYERYRHSRDYADEQAVLYKSGETLSHWHHKWVHKPNEPEPPRETVTGPAWVAWAYELAATDAATLVHTQGKQWQNLVDECLRLAEEYQERAAKSDA